MTVSVADEAEGVVPHGSFCAGVFLSESTVSIFNYLLIILTLEHIMVLFPIVFISLLFSLVGPNVTIIRINFLSEGILFCRKVVSTL